MFDGIVRTLTDVMHVLGLQRNLISLGALNSKGCKCNIVCGVLEVVKGALVIVEGVMDRNIYKLIGDTVPGGAVKKTSDNNGRKHIIHAELGATKSLED